MGKGEEERGERVCFLIELTKRAHNVNPGYPAPCSMEGVGEMELFPQSDSEESVEKWELAFEEDNVGDPREE